MLSIRRSLLSQTLLVTGALAAAANIASGQAKRPRRDAGLPVIKFVPGQVMLYCQPNTPQNEVNRLAALVGATATPLLLEDAYLLKMNAVNIDPAGMAAAIAQLKLQPSVRGAGPNNIPIIHQGGGRTGLTPNDPRYKDQYALTLINMPQAWTLQKGNTGITMACIDSGCDPKHEDAPVISPASTDVADKDSDPTADGGGGPGEFDHGTATSGVMLANTNNGKGIAGVIWNRVPLIFVKVQSKGVANLGGNDVQANAFSYIAKNAKRYNIAAVNYSIGAPFAPSVIDPSGIVAAAQQSCMSAGVHVVASAGNETYGGTTTADVPGIVKVSAVGRDPSKLAYYSNFNTITIAAPGGDQSTGDADGVLLMNQSTAPSTTLYSYEQGTSFAAPHVAAVLGLLRSVPGVDYNRAINALLNQANRSATGQTTNPDPKFGAGLLDAYASLVSVSNTVTITDPQGVDPATNTSTAPSQSAPVPVETERPRVRFRTSNTAKNAQGVPQINVTLTTTTGTKPLITNGAVDPSANGANGNPLVTNFYIKDVSTDPTFPQFDISFRYTIPDAPTSQQQQVTVTSAPSDPAFPAATASLVFTVQPHVFPAGVSMVSFPVAETAGDSPDPTKQFRDVKDILATNNVVLYRWINAPVVNANGKPTVQGQYAVYGTGTGDNLPQLATLHPSDISTTPIPTIDPRDNPNDPSSTVTNATPAGLGYFINLTAGSAVRSFGRTFTQQTVRVPLHEGWNMVGDPFTFPIAFSNATFQTANGTLFASSDAVTSRLILPYIYRIEGNDYEFQTLPNGTLFPWEGNWVYVIPKDPNNVDPSNSAITMVMTPTQSGSTRTIGSGVAHPGATRGAQSVSTRPDVRGPGSWALQLVARSKNMADAHNWIGMSSTAKDTDDLTKAPKPPRFASNVMLGISRGAQGGLYAQDLRALGGTKTWNIVVSTDQPNTDVNISWPNARTLPRNYQFIVKDNTTGQVVDIRNRTAFQFNSGPKAQAHEFTITAQPGNSGDRVVFNSVFVTPRGVSKATGQAVYQISYNVSHEAQVDVSILGTGGRMIAQLDAGRAAASGDNQAVWNGRDSQNHAVPAGAYVVRLRAVSSEGRVTQYHYPLTVTGR